MLIHIHAQQIVLCSRCVPCVRFAPQYAAFPTNPEFSTVAFVTVDIDAVDDAILDQVAIETVPTFLLLRDGREVSRVVRVYSSYLE